ncbi:MAG: CarD family transcriptional regulator [Anaerolineales bacterium]
MKLQIGDKVIHSAFGFAEIIGIEYKTVAGKKQQFYVVKTKDMLIWVPIHEDSPMKIRLPSSKKELHNCFDILRSAYSPFSTNRNVRKSTILSKMSSGDINALCEIIRDLSFYRMQNKINDSEKSILEKAKSELLDEWGFVFNITNAKARNELNNLLEESLAVSS